MFYNIVLNLKLLIFQTCHAAKDQQQRDPRPTNPNRKKTIKKQYSNILA